MRDVTESLVVSRQTLRKLVKQTALDRRERDAKLTSDEREELCGCDGRPPGSSRSRRA